MIIRYPSTQALRLDYIAKGGKKGAYGSSNGWYGGESEADSLRFAEVGDTRLVPAAEALLSKLDTAIEIPRKIWERNVIGSYYSVPDVIAGLPTSARRQVETVDDRTPITILVVTTSSAAINATTLSKRGTFILALVMALSRLRPVSLQQICCVDGTEGGETVITSEINTSPLDLATACYVLTSAGFARRLTYGLAQRYNNYQGGWPASYRFGKSNPYFDTLKVRLGYDPTKCLVIPSAELGDELLAEPLKWIEKQIKHFTNETEEALSP